MSLYDRLKYDNARIISGDDMQDVKLYNAAGTWKIGKARVTSVGIDVDVQSGQAFAGKKHSICFHMNNFGSLMATNESFKGWKAEFLNSEGVNTSGYFTNPLIDKTFGNVVATLTEKKVNL